MPDPFSCDFDAFLFDMDGTILNSMAVAERVWSAWALKYGIEPKEFLPTIHGRRAHETIAALHLTGVDPQAEAAAITQAEVVDVEGVTPIGGAQTFLAALPLLNWAVVTSAPRPLATRRLEAAGLPMPAVMVTAEDVYYGKPAPDCFLLAAQKLSVAPSRCLVFEDAPAGISAALAAGCQVVVITETYSTEVSGPFSQIVNYHEVRPQHDSGRLRITAI